MIKNFKWLLLVSLTFVACSESDDEVTYNSTDGQPLTSGSADFSRYVALGDSFAAGYSDGALFKAGQQGAYPNILAQQFALVGGGTFNTPYMNDNIGGLVYAGTTLQGPRLYFNGVAPTALTDTPTTDLATHLNGSFHNFGVPGAKSFHLLAPNYGDPAGVLLGTASPYFARFASNATTTVLQDALAQDPTFFSLWIGGNDELGYATAGGDPLVNPLTPPATFEGAYNAILTQLTAGGRKGVIANLPPVTTLPYFYVIKYNQLTQANLTDAAGVNQVDALNARLYGPIHNALDFLGQGNRINLLSSTGNNPMIMTDETLPDLSASLTAVLNGGGLDIATATVLGQVFGRARQTLPTDLICLSTASRLGKTPSLITDGVSSPSPLLGQLGVTYPLPDRYVLLPSEVTEIQTATDAYNATIEAAKVTFDLPMVDAKSIMNQLIGSGIKADGYTLTSTFVVGGAFSLDGIHPSPRGYALIANEFLKAINAKYGSNLKGVNLGNYRILFPADSSSF